VRLKSHEILETLTAFFVQHCPSKNVYTFSPDQKSKIEVDAEFISHERMYISQIVIQVARKSLEQRQDCYLQFNALILLDFLFQKLLPVPSFQNELIKAQGQFESREEETECDFEKFSRSESTPEVS
jgi:hypothetical protein